MDPNRRVGVAALAVITALLAACFSEGTPTSPSGDTHTTVTYDESRGRLIATGVRDYTNALISPNWVFLGNESEIAYATGIAR